MTLKIFDTLKQLLFGGSSQKQGKQAFPGRMVVTRFREGAKRSSLRGKRQKEIAEVRNGEERKFNLPFRKEIAQAMREERKLPLYPEDGNQDRPEMDILDEYDPGNVKWDNY